ncbi:phosphoadenosine phosphosulfate reductase family protein [Patescibacteria group bacterium]|nr:phosphoadenosine phosphosulfate reductase family protein [Patescibacteria group bacterium]
MKKYLSFGGGVNSVAMMLMLLDQKDDFEAIFVDHGTDWPETYEYFDMFKGWLKEHGHKPVTVLKPAHSKNEEGNKFDNLYDFSFFRKMVPSTFRRWCTAEFKVKPIYKYCETPCFMLIGIDFGEIKRAKISSEKGAENRYPLIENEVDREGCKKIIIDHGLPIPIKSGCYICPFQRKSQWIELRHKHPDLFCKAQKLENRNIEYQKSKGKKPKTLSNSRKKLGNFIEENQPNLFEQDDYPPCQCGL